MEFNFDEEDGAFQLRIKLENMDVEVISWGVPEDLATILVRLPIRAVSRAMIGRRGRYRLVSSMSPLPKLYRAGRTRAVPQQLFPKKCRENNREFYSRGTAFDPATAQDSPHVHTPRHSTINQI